MSYTNVDIRDRHHDRKRERLRDAELAFWQATADELQAKLENIMRAVDEWGEVELIDGSARVKLIRKPDEEPLVAEQRERNA